MNSVASVNENLFFALHRLAGANALGDQLVFFVAERLDWFVVVLGIIFIVSHRHKHNKRKGAQFRIWFMEAVYVSISVGFGWLISYIAKYLLARPRPFIRFEDIQPLFEYGAYESFPSGHATLFAALAAAIFWHHKRAGILFIILAVLISLARIIAGVHMPAEILAGWLIGGLSAWFVSTKIHT